MPRVVFAPAALESDRFQYDNRNLPLCFGLVKSVRPIDLDHHRPQRCSLGGVRRVRRCSAARHAAGFGTTVMLIGTGIVLKPAWTISSKSANSAERARFALVNPATAALFRHVLPSEKG